MADVSEEAARALGADGARLGVFFYLESRPEMRLWSGSGKRRLPADIVDRTGGVYLGLGIMISIPVLGQLINGVSERVDFMLSGVTDRVNRLAAADADSVRGAQLHLGLLAFDEHWQPHPATPTPLWVWDGEVSTPRVMRNGDVRSVGLSVGSAMTSRTRSELTYWDDIHQKRRSPDDTFCSRANLYDAGTTVRWPKP